MGISLYRDIMQNQEFTFSYFMNNKEEVINNLNLRLTYLEDKKYTCSDEELPYIDKEIKKIKNAIKFNKALFV